MQDYKQLFPILQEKVHGKPLVYLDNAATTQKPQVVIDKIVEYYKSYNSNIHRGAHFLANKATAAFENAREIIANHLNALTEEINFVKGTTDAVNLVASTWGDANIQEGDELLISGLEHHSNLVPWQMLAKRKKANIKIIPVLEDGSLDFNVCKSLLSSKTKLVAVNHVSNALGTINPIKKIIVHP